ncbi:TraX family protein [Atlantibacter hermannii]|uniref:TraX family protein n=1 Tax=Atlantibacter hermannii TaxID=565 RepID=UPI00254DD900|nr:TraX family protein [Atlantibacter hermannii]MDJ9217500.1 TraX family protein [Salmonella enterica]
MKSVLRSIQKQIHTALMSVGSMSPGAIDMVKVFALTAMFFDHLNSLFLNPPLPELYALGRMVFPVFVIIWARNLSHNPGSLQTRATRMWMWALIAQPVFWLAFQHQQPWYALNILFVFAGVTQLVVLSHRYGITGTLAGILLLVILAFPLHPASYGVTGLVFSTAVVAVFSPFAQVATFRKIVMIIAAGALFCLNGITHLFARPLDTLVIAILPGMLLPVMAVWLAVRLKPTGSPRFMPGQFFYHAYVGHLLLLALFLTIDR